MYITIERLKMLKIELDDSVTSFSQNDSPLRTCYISDSHHEGKGHSQYMSQETSTVAYSRISSSTRRTVLGLI